MKRIGLLLSAALMALCGRAATYSVEDIPNVHLADSSAYVSDPDGILEEGYKTEINRLMRSVRRNTSAEAVVVIVGDIEGGDIDTFATELFGAWGLGKKDKDNGLLILVAKDLKRAAIRPGYGLEGVLPDIVCGNILRHKMFPLFKEGDYGGGLVAASQVIETILTDPDAAEEIRSQLADADYGSNDDDIDGFHLYLLLAVFVACGMLVILCVYLADSRKLDHHDKYMVLDKLKAPYLAFTFLGLGIPLISSLPLLIILYRLRNSPHSCPRCGASMTKVDEVHDNEYLNRPQDLEERIGSVDYDVWLCPSCSETDIEQYVNKASGYVECGYCHAYTAKLYRNRILRQPTTGSEGHGVREYSCINCQHTTSVPYTIPKVISTPIVIGSGFGGGRGGFGGGNFGGGFGGGMTGGGGASGGW